MFFQSFTAAFVASALLLVPAAGNAATDTEALAEALHLGDAFAVMAEEGRAYGAELEAEMFPGAGGASWKSAVSGRQCKTRWRSVRKNPGRCLNNQ